MVGDRLMLVYYEKSTGKVVYKGTTGIPLGSIQYQVEMDWRHNLGPMGLNGNEIEVLVVDNEDLAAVDVAMHHEIEVDLTLPDKPKIKDNGRRPDPPLPPERIEREEGMKKIANAKAKGVKALTPAEKDDLLEALLSQRPNPAPLAPPPPAYVPYKPQEPVPGPGMRDEVT